MNVFIFLFLTVLSARGEVPDVLFSGNVRGDYSASYCRVSTAEIQLSPIENGNLSMYWLERGRLVQPLVGSCEIDYSGELTVLKRDVSKNPIEWILRFSYTPHYGDAFVSLIENVYRFRADTENFPEGRKYLLQLDLLYNSEENNLSYSRTMAYHAGPQETVFGILKTPNN